MIVSDESVSSGSMKGIPASDNAIMRSSSILSGLIILFTLGEAIVPPLRPSDGPSPTSKPALTNAKRTGADDV